MQDTLPRSVLDAINITVSTLRVLVLYRYEDIARRPASLMGDMLCSSLRWLDSTENRVDILPRPFEEVTLLMLGAAFFERGWLGPSGACIHPSDRVALGDIGYVTEAGDFAVVNNVHHSLQAESGALSWSEYRVFHSGGKFLKDTPADIIISQSGKNYQRRR